jgi:hypothetical protein
MVQISQSNPLLIELGQVRDYLQNFENVLTKGKPDERKRYVRCWVDHIKIAPDALEVVITYRVPEHLLKTNLAGAVYILMHKLLGGIGTPLWKLRMMGRKPFPRCMGDLGSVTNSAIE